ncbi:MAG: N-acetyltransferase [Phycisphaerales bacterium]|jgi:ribosomal protein S18 acetylase RimI-like enzyme|nr:N-acetyltransferase [Phycisphaerales bacterium]
MSDSAASTDSKNTREPSTERLHDPETIRIRRADFDDAHDVATVRRLVQGFADVSKVTLPPSVQDTVAPFLGRRAAFVLLAEDLDASGGAGRPSAVAMLIAQRILSSFQAGERINIHDLYVIPEAQGRGIGRRMLSVCADHAKALGCSDLTLEVTGDNAAARSLYRTFGFDLPEGDVPEGSVLYGKCPLS